MDGGIYDQYTDWMDSINYKERAYFASWDVEDGLSLPNELKTIFLGVSVEDSFTGYIFIEYYFNNNDDAEAEISALEDDAL